MLCTSTSALTPACVSVIPPGAALSPRSDIQLSQLGKIPGTRRLDGRWHGINHLTEPSATPHDVARWRTWGANIGLRHGQAPFTIAFDCDCDDAALADPLRESTLLNYPSIGVRDTTDGPRFAAFFRTDAPLQGCTLLIREKATGKELGHCEIRGAGGQTLIEGAHPTRGQYRLRRSGRDLVSTDEFLSDATYTPKWPGQTVLLDQLNAALASRGAEIVQAGETTTAAERATIDQGPLKAPDEGELRRTMARLRNTKALFPNRDALICVGNALHAAAADYPAVGEELFCAFVASCEDGVPHSREWAQAEYARIHAPHSLGFSYLDGLASQCDPADDYAAHDAPAPNQVGAEPAPNRLAGAIERLNQDYALVRNAAGGILHTPAHGRATLIPKSHWSDLLANDRVGQRKVSKLWLESPRRRTVERLVFEPALPSNTTVPNARGGADFNMYGGLAIQASPNGACDTMHKHIHEVLANGNETTAKWVTQWSAALVQRPDRRTGTALALRGAQGAGKTVFGEILGAILGSDLYVSLASGERLTGKFNSLLEGRLLIQAEEAVFAGDPRQVGLLKDLITNPVQTIERKGIEPVRVSNYARLLLTTNNEWVVPAQLGERRFTVLDVSDRYARNRAYHGALRRQMFEEGGCARWLHFLLHDVEVDWDFVSRPLSTAALRDQQIRSLDTAHRWLFDLLEAGELPSSTEEANAGRASTDLLFASFKGALRERGVSRVSREQVGKLLTCIGVERVQHRAEGSRVRSYQFPPLGACREAFAKLLAAPPEWDVSEQWAAPTLVLGGGL